MPGVTLDRPVAEGEARQSVGDAGIVTHGTLPVSFETVETPAEMPSRRNRPLRSGDHRGQRAGLSSLRLRRLPMKKKRPSRCSPSIVAADDACRPPLGSIRLASAQVRSQAAVPDPTGMTPSWNANWDGPASHESALDGEDPAGLAAAANPLNRRFYVGGEYLLWWIKGDPSRCWPRPALPPTPASWDAKHRLFCSAAMRSVPIPYSGLVLGRLLAGLQSDKSD